MSLRPINGRQERHQIVGRILLLTVALTAGSVTRVHSQPIAGSESVPNPSGPQLFQQKLLPIFDRNCLVCHGETIQRGSLDLRTPESVLRGGVSGAAVRPGRAEDSLLLKLVRHQQEPYMPMGGARLADQEIEAIAEWVNRLDPAEVPAGGKHQAVPIRPPGSAVTAQDRMFWSFQKPDRRTIPSVKQRAWVRNPIDAFVLKRLEEKDLRPSPPADRRVLIRRAYLDLIGLPPTPEEIDAFLRDCSPQAFESVVDRLLASPHYGERWGRHWLDLARYADSGGFEFDVDRPHAWRYRDYVIRSFNEDKPYDQFIREQLAGDELAPGQPESLVATGFCRNGPTVDNADNEQTRMDELDDMVSTTASVFLGLTVGCARCHDHKYDPISQRDYYRLQAIFIPSQKTETSLAGAEERAEFEARNKEIDALVAPLKDQIARIESPHRQQLLREKVERFVQLGLQTDSLEGKDLAAYRRDLAERFQKDVKLQPEEIEARLSAQELSTRQALQGKIEDLNHTRPKALPAVMGITNKESETPKAYLLKRGDFRQKTEEVSPGFLSVLQSENSPDRPNFGASASDRRLRLAEWLTAKEQPLTSRVMVNRLWQYHFGQGLVKTASDFGVNGERPTHPELLDWLAGEFIQRGWSLKAMHRLIMTSSTYQQASLRSAAAAQLDEENRWLWRQNSRRLEAEVIRDGILAVSGQLNRKMGGPGIRPPIDAAVIGTGSTHKWPLDAKEGPEVWRRSVYIYVKRSVILPLLEVFDCPDTTISSPMRSTSTVAPQALALLNNEFVIEQAGYFARRVRKNAGSDRTRQIERVFQLALGRAPKTGEMERAVSFLANQADGYRQRSLEREDSNQTSPMDAAGDHDFSALRDFCHALFNLSEFLYVD
ncbi:MAG: DUF1553 domain-containing protein [Acidobacteriota bacterium]